MRDRITSGLDGALHWMQTDGEVTEGSVSLRFELWSLGLRIFSEHPLIGAGVEGKDARWSELVATEPAYVPIGALTSADSDLIDALAIGGLLGAAGQVLAYLGAGLAFWRWRHHPDPATLALARMGLFLVAAYLIFGLSVSVFGINIFRALFATFTVTLLAFLTGRVSRLADGGT